MVCVVLRDGLRLSCVMVCVEGRLSCVMVCVEGRLSRVMVCLACGIRKANHFLAVGNANRRRGGTFHGNGAGQGIAWQLKRRSKRN
jgi:hypothetical protein